MQELAARSSHGGPLRACRVARRPTQSLRPLTVPPKPGTCVGADGRDAWRSGTLSSMSIRRDRSAGPTASMRCSSATPSARSATCRITGHARLIELCIKDNEIKDVVLATEAEGAGTGAGCGARR